MGRRGFEALRLHQLFNNINGLYDKRKRGMETCKKFIEKN